MLKHKQKAHLLLIPTPETQTSDKALQRSAMSIEADPWTPVQIVQAWADHEQVMGEDNLGGVIANAD